MNVSIQRCFFVTIGLLFCVLGCTRDRGHILMPDHISQPTEVMESTDTKTSFEQDIQPILTVRCALAGCHVADGPHGLDFRTYESFIAGGEHGPAFVPGNAQESTIVEQIVSGKMPPGGPPLTETEIHLFVDWINRQEAQDHVIQREHDEHGDEDADAHEEMDVEHADEHDDMDAEHDGDDEHEDADGHDDDDDDEHAGNDDDDNGHDDDEHDDDDDDN